MGKYIALVGEDYRSAINSLWAVLKQDRFEPNELYMILDERNDSSDLLKDDFKEILKNYEIDCSVEMNTLSEIEDLRRMIDGSDGNYIASIALDISAASKLTAAKVLIDNGCDLFDHIFYLKVESEQKSLPLPIIEKDKVKLKDLLTEEIEVR